MANFHRFVEHAVAGLGESGGHCFSYLTTRERASPLHFMAVQPQVNEVLAVAPRPSGFR